MRFALKTIILVFACQFLWGCSSTHKSSKSESIRGQGAYIATGKASFYAHVHQSKKTASGERYDHKLYTAAHRSLPFGTRVKVTNTQNGKSIVVKINDRGPYIKGRILDLSRSAFSSIANPTAGVITVKIEEVK